MGSVRVKIGRDARRGKNRYLADVVFPAPPPNYESQQFRDDVRRALTEGFGRPIAERLARWRASGKAHLFAGIAVGNETAVPYDLRPLLSTPEGQEPVGHDTTQRPPREVKIRRDEMVRAGYHALHDRGYTREKVRRLAEGRGVSVSDVVSELRHEIAHDYAEFRARVLAEAGLPRASIYTHFVSPMRPFIEKYMGSPMVDRFPRVRDSVNAHSRPGYTLIRESTDLPNLLAKIRDSRREAGGELGSAWAGVETYCTIGQPGRPQTLEEYEAYLGGLFAHDMRLINVYGWNVPREGPSAPFSVKNAPGVVQAVANWVLGKALPSDWRGAPPGEGGPPQGAMRLGPKMQRLQQLLAKRREAGDDISHIEEMMRPMEGLMREGKVEAAEQLVDRVLRAAQQTGDAPQTPAPTPEQPSVSLGQKAQDLQERIQRWVASGGDPNRIRPHAERLHPLLQAGNHAEAAEIIYHDHRFIFTMDRNGENVVQMTFGNPRHWEHVAVSYDHRYVLGNMHSTPGQSELWLFDLEGGTEARLVPNFPSAGGGGVAWDPEGRLYFAGSERSRQNDLYRINTDGTGLEQLTDTPQYYEADVGASEDGGMMTYAAAAAEGTCGIWVANTDGTEVRKIYKGGKVGTHSAHDPEFAPDGKRVVFSVVNSEHHNFVDTHNTAHDLWVCNLDGSNPTRITEPGAIRIIPNWQGEWIVFTEMSDQGEQFIGSAIVHEDGMGYRRLVKGGKMPEWIPSRKNRAF